MDRDADTRGLRFSLALIVGFMVVEIVVGLLASSLALLSDAAHMLTDAAALALSLLAARLATRPAGGSLTFGLGRAEILSAQANGLTLLVLGLLIVYGAIRHLISPPVVSAGPVLAVALAGIAVNLLATRALGGDHHGAHDHGRAARDHAHGRRDRGHQAHADAEATAAHPQSAPDRPVRSLNVEGSYRHLLTDLFAFVATAVAACVILATGLTAPTRSPRC